MGTGATATFIRSIWPPIVFFRLIITGHIDAFSWAQLLGSSRSVSCLPEQKWKWAQSLCLSPPSSLTASAVAPSICGEDTPHLHHCPERQNLIWGNCCPMQSIGPLSSTLWEQYYSSSDFAVAVDCINIHWNWCVRIRKVTFTAVKGVRIWPQILLGVKRHNSIFSWNHLSQLWVLPR